MKKSHRAILIDAEARTISEVELPEKESLRHMQEAVGGYIEAALQLGGGDTVYVNEEGLLQPAEKQWRWIHWNGHSQAWVGNAIVCGCNLRTGNNADLKVSLEHVKQNITFLNRDEVILMVREGKFK